MSDQRADGGASPAEEVKHDHSEDDDALANLEADFAIAKKDVARVKSDIAKAATAKAAAKAEGKAAAPTAKGKAGAPTTKEEVKGKGKAAAPKAKGKAAAPKAKATRKPNIFDINIWIAAHITRAETKSEPKRKNFVSNAHKRSKSAAGLCGVDDVQPITKRAKDAAGELHDSVHK